jgi:hypothetical protein
MARKTKREILEIAIRNAEKAGDAAAVEQLTAVLESLPAPRGGDKLRAAAARPAQARSAKEVLKVKPRRPAVPEPPGGFGPDLEERGYDDEERPGSEDEEAEAETVEVPQGLPPQFRIAYKEYLQTANAIDKVGRSAAALDALIQKLDADQARGVPQSQGGAKGHDKTLNLPGLSTLPPRGALPGAGGMANVVGGAMEDASNAPYIGGAVGIVTRPIGNLLRNTTKEGRELRQRANELELLGANLLVKGTGQISDRERAQVRAAWGLDTKDLYADQNIRIGVKKALADAAKQMRDLQAAYPDIAEYTERLGHSTTTLPADLESAYDPMSVYDEE